MINVDDFYIGRPYSRDVNSLLYVETLPMLSELTTVTNYKPTCAN